MGALVQSLFSLFKTNGVLAAIFAIGRKLRDRVVGSPVDQAYEQRKHRQGVSFDHQYATDTTEKIALSKLRIESGNWVHGNPYEPVSLVDFNDVLANSGINYEDTDFVDLGSGKGRALLMALRLPFHKVTGVEFAVLLNDIARENIRRFPTEEKRAHEITVLCQDVTEYEFEPSPLIVFMYNPFGKTVMESVRDRLLLSLEQHPRRVIVLYFTPEHASVWSATDVFETIVDTPRYCMFDNAEHLATRFLPPTTPGRN